MKIFKFLVISLAISYELIQINFRTPGAHGNDITMSEQADAACPYEFSAWTMTCADDSSSKFKFNLFISFKL